MSWEQWMLFTLTAARLFVVSNRLLIFQVQMVLVSELAHG